jgi:hypothetical protein
MKYDSGIEKISEWIQLNEEINGDLMLLDEFVPSGWLNLTTILSMYTVDTDAIINLVKIEKGLLRLLGNGSSIVQQDTFNVLSQHTAVKSSVTCMVCGKRGYRRKTLEGWPSLCTKHHVQYVNFLDEVNHGTTEEDL